MNFIIVTGMSGAGKSTAIKFFEDLGSYCVDNLPPMLIPNFAELIDLQKEDYKEIVLGIDIRGGVLFQDLFNSLEILERNGHTYEIIFFDCEDTVLIKRYKETRRLHPMARSERIEEGIEKERAILKDIKAKSSYIIDTSHLLSKDLKDVLNEIYNNQKVFKNLMVTVISFGFKYGIPIDADLVFDVRFIPNPYYIPEMRPLTGNDQEIKEYVLQFEMTQVFLKKLEEMIDFLLPNYMQEGKNQLVIAIGCTGGKHRSVTIANALYDYLKAQGTATTISHRDIDLDSKRGK